MFSQSNKPTLNKHKPLILDYFIPRAFRRCWPSNVAKKLKQPFFITASSNARTAAKLYVYVISRKSTNVAIISWAKGVLCNVFAQKTFKSENILIIGVAFGISFCFFFFFFWQTAVRTYAPVISCKPNITYFVLSFYGKYFLRLVLSDTDVRRKRRRACHSFGIGGGGSTCGRRSKGASHKRRFAFFEMTAKHVCRLSGLTLKNALKHFY